MPLNILLLYISPLIFIVASCKMRNERNNNEREKIKVACVGDSITYGQGIKERQKYAYPSQLGRILGERYEVKNFGVSGCTVLKKGDLPYWHEKAYQEAINYNPDIVIVKLGTNDSKFYNWVHRDQFIADYAAMIKSFKTLSSRPEIYICRPVPLHYTGSNVNDSVITGQVIPRIDSIGNKLSVPVIDLYQPLSNHPEHFPDGIHPNADGAGIIAQTVAGAIKDS